MRKKLIIKKIFYHLLLIIKKICKEKRSSYVEAQNLLQHYHKLYTTLVLRNRGI